MARYVGRGGEKLAAALDHFGIDPAELVCCDLGSNVGGFCDCLLARSAARVHAVDTSYGTLAWKVRTDARVVVHERTNALHLELPEAIDLVTVDVGWTRQRLILPAARRLLREGGAILSLVKVQYEADPQELERGKVAACRVEEVVQRVKRELEDLDWRGPWFRSPLGGGKRNEEYWFFTRPDRTS